MTHITEQATAQAESLFETDGMRFKYPPESKQSEFTPQLLIETGSAVGTRFAEPGDNVLLVRDTRPSGVEIESYLAEGLRRVGVNAVMLGESAPTPFAAWRAAQTGDFAAEIVTTASHNDRTYNGIKLVDGNGRKLTNEAELEISQMIRHGVPPRGPRGEQYEDPDLIDSYKSFLLKSAKGTDFSNWSFAVDCANGSASQLAPEILRELDATFTPIFSDAEAGGHINEGCGATHLEAVRQQVLENELDFGVAFDGDADRALFVMSDGNVFDGDQVLHMIARQRRLDGVVTTVMANMGFEHTLKAQGIDVYRTDVGDRHVVEGLDKMHYPLGGEQSGHTIFADEHTTGDGIFTMFKVLRTLQESDKTMEEWASMLELYPQALVNIPLQNKSLLGHEAVKTFVQGIEENLGDAGRVLIRPSGTEPLARVMLEKRGAEDIEGDAQKVAADLAELLKRPLRMSQAHLL